MGIQAIKGVGVGDGFTTATRPGSEAHDEIESGPDGIRRRTGRAGGIEGGMTTGDPVRVQAAMKPISTVPRALDTVDVVTGEPAKAINQRSDVTAVPAADRGARRRGRRRGDGGAGARPGHAGEVRW
jgi:chorismate synthase